MAFWKNKKEKERQMPDQAPEDAVKTGNDETTTKDESVAQTKRKKIDEQAVREAAQTLKQYQAGKKNLENRIKEEEEFFRLRIWDHIRSTMTKEERERDTRPQPTSAWLFNSVINKHADMMDNYPTFACLPREQSDEESAKILSSVLPVILERRNFEETYSRNSYSKVKFGTGVYGVSWNRDLEDGLGDIDITRLNIMNVYWEPGVDDIQKSRNVFVLSAYDKDLLEQDYPELKEKKISDILKPTEFIHDDTVLTDNKAVVVDWYYKIRGENGKILLHYCKFVGDKVLFASENMEEYQEKGYYWHGEYPVHMDVMYPVEDAPYGFGTIAVAKDPQIYIDKLDKNILQYSDEASRIRFFGKKTMGINKEQFNDLNERIVDVEGEPDEQHIRQIPINALPSFVVNVKQMKIDELKDTSANKDVTNGSVSSGVTSGAGIAALQEAGNKTSRDLISGSYRCYVGIMRQVIELIRQNYTEERCFRIVGENGIGTSYLSFSNENISEQITGYMENGEPMFRKPVFDIDVRAQKRSPFSQMAQNETATNLYNMGIFQGENAQMAMGMLNMMDFDGIEKVKEYVQQGETYLNVIRQQQQQMDQMAQLLAQMSGSDVPQEENENGGPRQNGGGKIKNSSPVSVAYENAAEDKLNAYGKRIRQAATPQAGKSGGGASPK